MTPAHNSSGSTPNSHGNAPDRGEVSDCTGKTPEKQSNSERLSSAQQESTDERSSHVSEHTRRQRQAMKKRLEPNGKPSTDTCNIGHRVEITDGDKTIISGWQGTELSKTMDGHISSIKYPDGSSREFRYARNGEINQYKAPDGSFWRSDDGLTWSSEKGGKQLVGLMRVEPDGTFKFLNAGDNEKPAHLTLCFPNGMRSNHKDGDEVTGTILEIVKDQIKTIDKSGGRQVSLADIEQSLADPQASGARAFAATLLYVEATTHKKDSVTPGNISSLSFLKRGEKNFGTILKLGSRTELKPDHASDISSADVIQGNYDDCKFLAAMSSMTLHDRGKQQLFDMVQRDDYGYAVQFPHRQQMHLPELTTGEKMMAARSNYLYAAVMEKAYGQIRREQLHNPAELLTQAIADCSDRLFQRTSLLETKLDGAAAGLGEKDNQAISILTGKHPDSMEVKSVNLLFQPDRIKVEESLKSALNQHRPITAGIETFSTTEVLDEKLGALLHMNHEYSVVGYDENSVYVRDPHGDIIVDLVSHKTVHVLPVNWRDFHVMFAKINFQSPDH